MLSAIRLMRYGRTAAFWLFAISLIDVVISVCAAAADIRIMSFNVRFAMAGHSESAAENNWNDPEHPRRERALRVIREANPDLLGVQEARELQINDLQHALPAYEFYGVGRDDGKMGGEFSGIYYRKGRFAQQAAGSFWLSATPEKPGTTFAAKPNKIPRIASWVRLTDRDAGRDFVFLNMHWDHIDVPAREKSATLVRERLTTIAKGLPAIVTGDLNSHEDTRAFTTLTAADAGGRELFDSYRKLHSQRSSEEATFNNWKHVLKGSRIDFILYTAEFTPKAAEIIRTTYDERLPSDHYPVTATLQLRGTANSPEQK